MTTIEGRLAQLEKHKVCEDPGQTNNPDLKNNWGESTAFVMTFANS